MNENHIVGLLPAKILNVVGAFISCLVLEESISHGWTFLGALAISRYQTKMTPQVCPRRRLLLTSFTHETPSCFAKSIKKAIND
jgi:hypothetical protein